ncbi:hypothetical protein Bhyg_01755, partial [Pseudolycoriella hygida]
SNVWSIEDFKETNNSCSIQATNFFENLSKRECYALGATALDCSIMLTFQCVSGINSNSFSEDVKKHIVSIDRNIFLVNATVVDVDPKTPQHFVKYIKQTNLSHKAYLEDLAIESKINNK